MDRYVYISFRGLDQANECRNGGPVELATRDVKSTSLWARVILEIRILTSNNL
jgi:hypothetical protein